MLPIMMNAHSNLHKAHDLQLCSEWGTCFDWVYFAEV